MAVQDHCSAAHVGSLRYVRCGLDPPADGSICFTDRKKSQETETNLL